MKRLGRRLPPGAQFVHVEQLTALNAAELDRWEVWLGDDIAPSAFPWMPAARLLDPKLAWGQESTLTRAPSALVIVARRAA